jgi:hypothetical protein
MVFFYYPVNKGDYLIYIGKDKYENEDLIKHALPNDVWVHADGFSSPHAYIRVPHSPEVAAAWAAAEQKGAGVKKGVPPYIPPMPAIPADVLEDACQLVKEGSIKGCKEVGILFFSFFGEEEAAPPRPPRDDEPRLCFFFRGCERSKSKNRRQSSNLPASSMPSHA